MEKTVIEQVKVSPRIGLLNHYVHRVKRVAISSIDPVFSVDNELEGFNVKVEGPPRHMSYLNRLIASDTNLKVS